MLLLSQHRCYVYLRFSVGVNKLKEQEGGVDIGERGRDLEELGVSC